MVYINEWLPNPVGVDAKGEFIELYNGGGSSVNLNGWFLRAGGKKLFSLSGRVIGPGAYLLLTRSETKLSLPNTDGALSLYNASGSPVDRSSFQGAAPEGKSFSRVEYGPGDAQHFAFVSSTPGGANATINITVAAYTLPFDVTLDPPLNAAQFFAMMIGVAAVLAAVAIYFICLHEDLSQLFFGRDEKIGT